jgi:myo-inositol-1(or 4)-monophosphatase
VNGRHDSAVSIGVEPTPAPDDEAADGPAPPAGERASAGAVLLPALGRLFVAGDNPLTDLNTAPLQVSDCTELAEALVGVGYPQGASARLRAHTWLGSLLASMRDYRRIGSAACDLVNVATGAQDGYLAFGVKPWDVGGGFALVRAVGGRAGWTATASGRQVAVAGTPAVHAALVELVGECEV